MITKEEAAARLDGCKYGSEGWDSLWEQMKAAGLVAVFGASDDLIELRGAELDEVSAYGGGEIRFTRRGLFRPKCAHRRGCDCSDSDRQKAAPVVCEYCEDPSDASWVVSTSLPHAKFNVLESGVVLCEGIVFSLADCPEV